MTEFQKKWHAYEDEFLTDLRRLVEIASVRDTTHATPGCPFGPKIAQAMDCFIQVAEKCGLETHNLSGYACDARLGEQSQGYIGILGHLDVVEARESEQWHTPPFTVTLDEQRMLYGRGVNDDKGPLLATLYAVRIMKDLQIPLKYGIRIIAGGAEETTWECMDKYFSHEPQPLMGFSPDGNFPIVNGEKGIRKYDLVFRTASPIAGCPELHDLTCATLRNYVCDDVCCKMDGVGSLRFTGQRALSRNPQRGQNALFSLAQHFRNIELAQPAINACIAFLNDALAPDPYGRACGLYASDADMGTTSVCPTGCEQKKDGLHLYVDIRYPRSITPEELDDRLQRLGTQYGFDFTVEDQKRLLYVAPDHPLITALGQAYTQVTGEQAECLTKGGASYARVLDCGIAFGATFPDEETYPHMPNERISLDSLSRAAEIYFHAIRRLSAHELDKLPQ